MQFLTRTTRTPAFWGYPPPPHDYPYHWVILDPKSKDDQVKVTKFKNSPKFQIFEFWNGHYTRHTFWSCLIRCANMKWIRWVLLKIQSGHDSVHRRTDGQTDKVIPVYPLINFVEARGIMSCGRYWYFLLYDTCIWALQRIFSNMPYFRQSLSMYITKHFVLMLIICQVDRLSVSISFIMFLKNPITFEQECTYVDENYDVSVIKKIEMSII